MFLVEDADLGINGFCWAPSRVDRGRGRGRTVDATAEEEAGRQRRRLRRLGTDCVTELDWWIKMIIFESLLTTFEASFIFLRQVVAKIGSSLKRNQQASFLNDF